MRPESFKLIHNSFQAKYHILLLFQLQTLKSSVWLKRPIRHRSAVLLHSKTVYEHRPRAWMSLSGEKILMHFREKLVFSFFIFCLLATVDDSESQREDELSRLLWDLTQKIFWPIRCVRGIADNIHRAANHSKAWVGHSQSGMHLHPRLRRQRRAGRRVVQRQPRHDAERHTGRCLRGRRTEDKVNLSMD